MMKDKEEIKVCWKSLESKMEHLKFSNNEKEFIREKLLHDEAKLLRMQRKKIQASDFESISIIGRGAFGEVRVCR